ncbi:MAG: XrtA-associated ATPase [Candidatus Accumulibacter phosphatis]|jgi:general secretion pathway protein A|uniref:AAA family ATPase n=1 Tax=Candidatus Accumulibacter cognatus TaxID=2954383 RepID=A0A080MKN2_9PROT|nr:MULTISPECIES: XrtA/PEP-CTERM system-associated ATPase [Candidatus Accumulibacter]MCQ1549923.1 XrtA-associated ATPase [Candidatus Accumulibacter phosphatis]KFB77999.1 MAG: putative secretion ATPase, PEP-CTERM locus subfamily [Candidatus Accumulibacter cognatus]MBN8517509.1 AAA family ATPase [Accumulibacter sp.]MBO3711642.1 AAA family ATPase [Accumulibacter sp.]QLH50317.1 MAG: AAA family ATPase [Candidatus Accumulibacter cognatus]
MYESFYGLTSKPFQLNPDPAFYFASKQHRRAMAYLEYGLNQNEGFIVVTGEVGAGKTTIVRGLLNDLDIEKVLAAQLVSTQLDADDILRMVAGAFGVATRNMGKSDMLLALEAFLVDVTRQGKRCLLIVDEAQNLTPRAVEELRMLSNFQFGTQALLQSFLIGQPEFRKIMQSPQMQQLRQRVIAACHIGPMDQDETQAYIEHRLRCAGSKGSPRFDAGAFEALFEASGGVPRRINAHCDRLLLSGFLNGKSEFTRADVEEVAKEIKEETQSASQLPANPPIEAGDHASVSLQPTDSSIPDIDLSRLTLDASTADQAARVISDLKSGQVEQRLIRIERSMFRLERNNAALLSLLQQLIDAIRAKP